jgi:hypothetical protein
MSRNRRRAQVSTRVYGRAGDPAVVELSVRGWAPVFTSMPHVLEEELFRRLHGDDWRAHQAKAVRRTLADEGITVWVAETGRRVVGFIAATVLD